MPWVIRNRKSRRIQRIVPTHVYSTDDVERLLKGDGDGQW